MWCQLNEYYLVIVFGGYLRFVPSGPFPSVLVPCRAALHPRSSVYGPHTNGTSCMSASLWCGLFASYSYHGRSLSPNRGPPDGETLSCIVRVVVPGSQSSAPSFHPSVVRACPLFVYCVCIVNYHLILTQWTANSWQYITHVCGLLIVSHQNSNQATDSSTRMAHNVKGACWGKSISNKNRTPHLFRLDDLPWWR